MLPERARAWAIRSIASVTLVLLLVAQSVPAQVGGGLPGNDGNNDAEQSLPDLLVFQAGTRPPRPHEEAPFEVCVDTQNYGNSRPGPFSVAIVWDGDKTEYERYTSFPDTGAVFCTNVTADAGQHVFEVFVDVENEVLESSEDNNYRSVPVTVREKPLPDITVNLSVTPDPPRRGESLVLTGTLRNVGAAAADNFSVDYYVNDVRVAHRAIPPGLNPGYRYDTAFVIDADILREGNYTVRVVVDELGYLREVNEDNNVDVRTVYVPRLPQPELTVNDFTVARTIREGQVLNVTAEIRNHGDRPTGPFVVRFLLDNETTVGLPRVEELRPLSSVNVSTSWAARAPGDHFVRILVDANGDVEEDNEVNNERNFTLTVTPRDTVIPRPDLVVDRVLTSPFRPVPGDVVGITAVVHNAGSVKSPPANVSFFVDGERLNATRTAEIATGGYLAYTVTWNATLGAHDVRVVADEEDAIAELNESNNSRTVTVHVTTTGGNAPDAPPPAGGNATDDDAGAGGDADPDAGGGNGSGTGDSILDRNEAPVVVLEVVQAGYVDVVQQQPDPRLIGRVVNRGNAVSPPFLMEFWLDGEKVGEREAQGLGPGRDLVLSWGGHTDPEWTRPSEGEHTVRIRVIEDGETTAGPLTDKSQTFTVSADASDGKAVPAPAALALATALAVARALRRRERAA